MKGIFYGVALVVLAVAVGALLTALPVMWLWNYVMPGLFGVPSIGFWQALCLTLLCGLLFQSGSSSSSKE